MERARNGRWRQFARAFRDELRLGLCERGVVGNTHAVLEHSRRGIDRLIVV